MMSGPHGHEYMPMPPGKGRIKFIFGTARGFYSPGFFFGCFNESRAI